MTIRHILDELDAWETFCRLRYPVAAPPTDAQVLKLVLGYLYDATDCRPGTCERALIELVRQMIRRLDATQSSETNHE